MPSLFIDRAWTAGSGGTADVVNPFDTSVVQTVDLAGRDDVDRAVAAARRAFDTGPWPGTPVAERAALLRRVADLLVRGAIIMIYIAYLLVTVPLLRKRLRGEWPDRDGGSGYFSLGRLGLPVNVVAVVWGAAMAVNLAWPREEVYGAGWLRWIAFIFIGAVAGRAWCGSC